MFTKKTTMQGTFANLCYTMENHGIATMMTYFGSTDHGLGTEGMGGTSSKNRLESQLIYIYIYIYIYNVNKDCKYPKNECSMDGYLIQNIPAEQNIFFNLKIKKFSYSIP